MKISYNWLTQYINISLNVEELAEKLTMAGIEVEAIHRTREMPKGLIAGEILERKPHPNADKLSICTVNTGTEKLQIVCGAPNCDAGVKAPLATIGTVFKGPEAEKDFEIKKCKLRGEESSGMLCSGKELGLDDEHSGILELPVDTAVGTPLSEIFKPDVMFELEITSNRPDWLSHWGIARDVAALTGSELKFPEINLPEIAGSPNVEGIVKVEDFELCPRYTGRIIRNVTVKESPDWLKERLLSIGLRPINNIVDITNFVLMELGQPLHAFDLDDLAEKRIIVRRARKCEKIMTLDGDEHELDESRLVIADAEKPVALAGVMGGEHSGVTDKTVNVLLESAYFKPSNIRQTSRDLGISSDSSYRFERGVDWKTVEAASGRATSMILELAGGELVTGFIDVKESEPEQKTFECRFEKIRGLVGADISNHEIVDIFERLGIPSENIENGKCLIKVPSFRLDIEREADLAEEVARIHGLDKIPEIPVAGKNVASFKEDAYAGMEKLRDELISLGLWECINYTMTDEKSALADSRFSTDKVIKLSNPISVDQAYLRPSLLQGLLNNVEHNISRQNTDLALFETGLVFCADPELYPEERKECCIAITGRKHPERFSAEKEEVYDFFDMKGLIEEFLDKRKLTDVRFSAKDDSRFVKGECAVVMLGDRELGTFGKISERHTKGMRIKYPLYIAILDADLLLASDNVKILYLPIPQYPATSRDVAFVASGSLEHRQVIDFIQKADLKNLENVELFDVFEDEKTLGAGKKSMAYSLTFRSSERTLKDEEVNSEHEKLRKKLASELKVELR